MNKLKVAAYCRVSTDKTDQINSLRNQRDYFEQYCAEKSIELVDIYKDEGISGTSWRKRDDFIRMLKDAGLNVVQGKNEIHLENSDRQPKFERILIKDVSRFARNAGNAADIIERLRYKGVHIDFITAGLSTDQLSADVLLKIMAVLAEAESKDRSVKTLFGQRRGAERGVIKTADVLYGYQYIKDENDLEIVPEEAEIVKFIYDQYVQGLGFRRLINELEQKGYKTRRGKRFAAQTIRRILSNPIYKGVLIRNRFAKSVFDGRLSAAVRPETEWVIHEGRVQAIVDTDLWERAQVIRQSKVHSEMKRGVRTSISPYAGKIKCGICGNNYIKNRESRTGRDFYLCKVKKMRGVSACSSRNIGLDEIETLLDRARESDIQKLFKKHKQDIIDLIRFQISITLEKRIDRQDEAAASEKTVEIESLHEQKRRLADLFLTGAFNTEFLSTKAAEIDAAIDKATNELQELLKSNDDIKAEIADIEHIIEEIQQIKFEERDIIRVVKSITVHSRDSKVPLMLEFTFSDLLEQIDFTGTSGEVNKFMNILRERFKGPIMTL